MSSLTLLLLGLFGHFHNLAWVRALLAKTSLENLATPGPTITLTHVGQLLLNSMKRESNELYILHSMKGPYNSDKNSPPDRWSDREAIESGHCMRKT